VPRHIISCERDRVGFTRDEVQNIGTKALEPTGIIILVGVGGVF
jgi:hypothetical protein